MTLCTDRVKSLVLLNVNLVRENDNEVYVRGGGFALLADLYAYFMQPCRTEEYVESGRDTLFYFQTKIKTGLLFFELVVQMTD